MNAASIIRIGLVALLMIGGVKLVSFESPEPAKVEIVESAGHICELGSSC